jgi:hypothetical protein
MLMAHSDDDVQELPDASQHGGGRLEPRDLRSKYQQLDQQLDGKLSVIWLISISKFSAWERWSDASIGSNELVARTR